MKKIVSFLLEYTNNSAFLFLAIQFVLSDEFSHLRPEQRLALLHVSEITFRCYYVFKKNTLSVLVKKIICSSFSPL